MAKKSFFEKLGLVEGVAASEYEMPEVANENIEDSKIKTDAKNTDESPKNNLNVEEKSEEDTVHEQRPIVQKIKVDESNFEYNRNLDNKSDNDFDINLSDGFDDRMGSSSLDDATNSSENDSII